MSIAAVELIEIEQGSPQWLALRKTKVTATDAPIVLGVSRWKNKIQLYHEKLSDDQPASPNAAMQRGLDLEPIARDLFNLRRKLNMEPVVMVRDWLMASLDGWDSSIGCVLEIKCAGSVDHESALKGKVPDHYYPQLQLQMYVSGAQQAYYDSFDGIDEVVIVVDRDDSYIEKMLPKLKEFYDCLVNKTPPEPDEDDYIYREDEEWIECCSKLKVVMEQRKSLEMQEEELRNQLIFLSGESNTKGGGISLCQVERRGNVDYAKIPALKGMDLEPYRKPSSLSWRITCS